jgi:hypothetical protein
MPGLKQPVSQENGFPLPPVQIKNLLQCRTRCGAQVEDQDGRTKIIDDHAGGHPGFAPGLCSTLTVNAMESRKGSEAKGRQRLAAIQSVSIAGAFSGEIGQQDFSVSAPQHDAQRTLQEDCCAGEVTA